MEVLSFKYNDSYVIFSKHLIRNQNNLLKEKSPNLNVVTVSGQQVHSNCKFNVEILFNIAT